MNKKLLFSIACIIIMTMISCNQPEKLSGKEYIAWFNSEKNPAVQKVDGEQFNYAIKYTPTDYILSMEALNGIEADREKRKNQLKDQMFFQFQIQMEKDSSLQANEATNDKKFEELKEYIRIEAQKDFNLKANSKKLSPVIYHMERSVIYNTITVIIGFEVKQKVDEFTLEFKNSLSEDELSFEFETDEFPMLIRS